jgi:hypothetical protein
MEFLLRDVGVFLRLRSSENGTTLMTWLGVFTGFAFGVPLGFAAKWFVDWKYTRGSLPFDEAVRVSVETAMRNFEGT